MTAELRLLLMAIAVFGVYRQYCTARFYLARRPLRWPRGLRIVIRPRSR